VFREKVLKLAGLDGAEAVVKDRRRDTRAELKDLDLKIAGKIVKGDLRVLKVGRKVLLAHLLMGRSSVRQKWIVEELGMGSAPYVSRLAREVREKLEKGDRSGGCGNDAEGLEVR
jgi:hypothetical protein